MSSKIAEYVIIASVLGLAGAGYFYNQSSEDELTVAVAPQDTCTAASFPLDDGVKKYIDQQLAKINAADSGATVSSVMSKLLDFEKIIDEHKIVLEKSRQKREQREANQQKENKTRLSVQDQLAKTRATEAARLKAALIRSCANLQGATGGNQRSSAMRQGMRGSMQGQRGMRQRGQGRKRNQLGN